MHRNIMSCPQVPMPSRDLSSLAHWTAASGPGTLVPSQHHKPAALGYRLCQCSSSWPRSALHTRMLLQAELVSASHACLLLLKAAGERGALSAWFPSEVRCSRESLAPQAVPRNSAPTRKHPSGVGTAGAQHKEFSSVESRTRVTALSQSISAGVRLKWQNPTKVRSWKSQRMAAGDLGPGCPAGCDALCN